MSIQTEPIALIRPTIEALPRYVAALHEGWSSDTVEAKATAERHLRRIDEDAQAFIDSRDDPEGRGEPLPLPDGTARPRLPSIVRWVWDGDFCGSIDLRWLPGTPNLPEHVLGHIGYGIVPWKRRRGFATEALRLILPEAWARGLPLVDLSTDPANIASQRVILANGGHLVGRFRKPEYYGGGEGLHFRITT